MLLPKTNKLFTYVICVALLIMFCSPFIQAKKATTVDEWIRIKIENLGLNNTALNQPIICTAAITAFYQDREFQSVWNKALANEMVQIINASVNEGLNPEDYHAGLFNTLSFEQAKTPTNKADYDLLLTDAFLLYCSHLQSGKVNPKTISPEWHVIRREGDPVLTLKQALLTNQLTNTLYNVLPTHPEYQSLKESFQICASLLNQPWNFIPAGETIKIGMEDTRIPLIRERLNQLGDLTPVNLNQSEVYDEGLRQDIVQFQTRHGLENEGEIGKKTLAALNITPANRLNQVKANLERWRWLPQAFGNYYIKVNIANFKLTVVKNNQIIAAHKVIAGKPARMTPVFSATLQYLVFNPTWTVPPGILKADVIPALKKDTTYLDKKKIAILDESGNSVSAASINWNSNQAYKYTYRQPPGPNNALGAVKFMFPNNFQVYLHDTPNKELFDKTERAFSSGCIRVQNPLELAILLLNDSVQWNNKSVDKIIATQQTQTIHLVEKPEVFLLYWTVWADELGKVNFRPDVYNRDGKLIEALLQSATDLR